MTKRFFSTFSSCSSLGHLVGFFLFFSYTLRKSWSPNSSSFSFHSSFFQEKERNITDFHKTLFLDEFIKFSGQRDDLWKKWPETMKKAQLLAEKKTFNNPYGDIQGDYQYFFEHHPPQTLGGWAHWAKKFSRNSFFQDSAITQSSKSYEVFQKSLEAFWQSASMDAQKEKAFLQFCRLHLPLESLYRRVIFLLWTKEKKKALSLWNQLPQKSKVLSHIMGILKRYEKLTPEILLKEKPKFQSELYELFLLRTLIHFGRHDNNYEEMAFLRWQRGSLRYILDDNIHEKHHLNDYKKDILGTLEVTLARSLLHQGFQNYNNGNMFIAKRFFLELETLGLKRNSQKRDAKSSLHWYDLCFLKGLAYYGGLKNPEKALEYFLILALEGKKKQSSEFSKGPNLTFQQMPYHKARGFFFSGLCFYVMGQEKKALECWKIATQWPFSFYGQLSFLFLKKPYYPSLIPSKSHEQPSSPFLKEWMKKGKSDLDEAFIKDFLNNCCSKDDFQQLLCFVRHIQPQKKTFMAQKILYISGGQYAFQEAYPLVVLPDMNSLPKEKQSLIYSLILQETCFIADSVSSAGALGLMQILPSVGKEMARSLGHPSWSVEDFLKPKNNILLGRKFFDKLLKNHQFSYMDAIGAYNGGSSRMKRWKSFYPSLSSLYKVSNGLKDQKWLWMEMVPIEQTRHYIVRVLSHYMVYRSLFRHQLTFEELKKII